MALVQGKPKKIEPLRADSLLAMLKNAAGTKLFRTVIARVDGKKQDILEQGNLSCAFFVSSVLTIFELIGGIHTTVAKTIADMQKSGWRKIRAPLPGAVLVWETHDGHRHIGFALDGTWALSTSSRRGVVAKHDLAFRGRRAIESIWWHRKLARNL